MDLPTAIKLTLEECPKTQGQIADELGIAESILSMFKSGVRELPASLIIPLARATGNLSIVKHLASRVGLVSCTPPPVPRDELAPQDTLSEHELAHNTARHLVVDYLRHPSDSAREQALVALYDCMGHDLRLHDMVRRHRAPELGLYYDMEAPNGR
jgi:DNA-binding transcriptional regulator YdaS (Cro superfamily)